MARKNMHASCPDCDAVDRRDFLTTAGAAAFAAGSLSLSSLSATAAPTRKSAAESAVKRLYESLSDEQRKIMALSWNDQRRTKISPNWSITNARVGSFSADQKKTIEEIVRGVTSEDGYERFQKQMKADWGGFDRYSVAIFGKPSDDKFGFELTGRHLTLRADGDTTPGAAFGGPVIYGHSPKGNSKNNLFFYQTKRANEVFKALDGGQRKKALLSRAPKETAVELREEGAKRPGILCGDLSKDQLELVQKVLADILLPYRKEDADEVLECVKAGGGFEKINMAFYQTGDLDDDGVWDIWRLEGPTLVSHFRGAPHVHAYLNVARRS